MYSYRSEESANRYRAQSRAVWIKRLLLLALLGLAAAGYFAWPRLAAVETGRTAEYPDLQPRRYAAPVAKVAEATRATVEGLGWTFVASGSGPGGQEITAIAPVPVLHLRTMVAVRVRREEGRTVVSVRSRSEYGPLDFGQNARNVRALLAALDGKVK
jgi:hypothetical protein